MKNIKGYQIIKELGRGGMATVYLAKEEGLDREVALKILTIQVSDQTFKKSFLAEARLVAQLEHPDIIKIYSVNVEDNQFYMEMELLREGTLKERLTETTLSISTILSIIKQMASALSYAHNKGCIHRDIKPANILFRSDDDVVLADFGIAKQEGSDSDLTRAGHSGLGTPNYMSPEQAMGEKVDGRTDMYSLGVVLYEMLAQEKLFTAADISGIIRKHMTADIPRLPATYEHFQPVIDKVLSKNKKHRYNDILDFSSALMAAHENNGSIDDSIGNETIPFPIKKPTKKTKSLFLIKSLFIALLMIIAVLIGIHYLSPQGTSFITALFAPSEKDASTDTDIATDIATFPTLTPNMQLIKGGVLSNGCSNKPNCISPKKTYTLQIADFLISKTEVSFSQWDRCVVEKGCSHQPDDQDWGREKHPVINVNWNDIQEYIAWLNKETGLVYRLPTEAQWQYAAKAGQETRYPWGDNIAINKANCDGCKSQWDNKSTAPIASFAAYGGLYDMYGNVGEWTCSAYKDHSHYLTNRCADNHVPRRVLRGGSWEDEPEFLHSAPSVLSITKRHNAYGFRLVRMP